jgi:hypothetical protein
MDSFAKKMKCLNWNLEWKPPATKAGRLIQAQVAAIGADMVCYTEVDRTLVPDGHSIESNPDYGYPNDGERRKVILWSRQPWTEIDMTGDGQLSLGRARILLSWS